MKIDLSKINTEDFRIIKEDYFGEEIVLVYPLISAKWTKQNLFLRSSLWNQNGELISAGFPKFFNWGEKSNIVKHPKDLNRCQIVEKLDGSLLILSKYKGHFIYRTRGTIDAFKHDNGDELKTLFKKYPLVKTFYEREDTWDFSLLFEWVSPINKIILNYGNEVDFVLVGGICHSDYELFVQNKLDLLAEILELHRPKVYTYSSLEKMLETIKNLKEVEGVVVYSNGGQYLHKVKTVWYLSLHRMKSEFSSLSKTLDVWFRFDKPNYNKFYSIILNQFDYELAEFSREFISKICDASKEVEKIFDGMKKFIEPLKEVLRKDAAIKIMSVYGKISRSGICFKLLDGKELSEEEYKKVMLQLLNEE